MIRNTFNSILLVSKGFYCFQIVSRQACLKSMKQNKNSINQPTHQNQASLTLNCRYFFFKNDVTIDYKKNYYEILKINEKATLLDIKRSFYKLAKESHPDTSKGNEDVFKQINQAYNVLSHQQRKKLYDVNRYRPTVQNSNDHKSQQQDSRSSENSSTQQNYRHSQHQQRSQEPYYHHNRGQWQQFRSGYKYTISPQSQYYTNITNNASGQKIYSNFKRKFSHKTQKEQQFLDQMQKYLEYQQKIRNKKRKDIEDYHRKMEQLQKQLYEERKRKFLNTFLGKGYSKIINIMEKFSDKFQSYLTKENEKQK